MKWIEVKNDLKLERITQEDILNRDIFRSKVHKWQADQEDNRSKKPEQHGQTRERKPIAKEWENFGFVERQRNV